MPSYKSYCWSLGTTSFRMVEFNRKIEKQLELLRDFWENPDFANQQWAENEPLQEQYYNHLKENDFIEGDAPRKAKDAREKTSGLVDLGLIDNERRLTEAGSSLLQVALTADFNNHNLLQIPADSFLYLKQLLKVYSPIDSGYVRPYIVLTMALNRLGELSFDEFTYLLPLAINESKTPEILDSIERIRSGNGTIDETLITVLMNMSNYKEALDILLRNDVTESLITAIGMNRKSRTYDKPYFRLYKALQEVVSTHSDESAINLFNAVKSVSGKCSNFWKQYLFNTSLTSKVRKEGFATINTNARIFHCSNETEFKTEFFKLMHLFKAKSTLSDYFDLNRRYFKTTDTLLFQDNKVKFDIIPNCFFQIVERNLTTLAYAFDENLSANISLDEIVGIQITENQIFAKVEEIYGVQVRNLYDVQAFVDRERYERFNAMIDNKFTDENIIALMTAFEDRRDGDIQSMVTNNADIPTIFEYVLAIAWYKISGRQGKILDYMNLSLDADLLPVTHAAGGHEDITYKYEATEDYPAHTLLLEATLANSTNQRRMEMEPVSRHLGEYLLSHADEHSYCLFATTYLHINVISDFRMRKSMPYYSSDGTRSIDGMKIIPCQTSEIKTIISKKITYAELYCIFQDAFDALAAPNIWYEKEIKNKLVEEI